MKILIIKLGALGDVLRTTPILTAIHEAHRGSQISWLVDPSNADILNGNSLIRRVYSFSKQTLSKLERQAFDVAINLDKEPEALQAITAVKADRKMGFGRSAEGQLTALDAQSDYALRLGMDDDLKFRRNQKTYQEISFEQAHMKFRGEEYVFDPGRRALETARRYLKKIGFDSLTAKRPVIGINTGSGRRFAGKKLPLDAFTALAESFVKRMDATVMLLGGEDEVERNAQIERNISVPIYNTGSHPIRVFAAIVRECDLVISGDTTAMHVAIGMKVPVVAYFASTCAAEIELYGRGRKIVSDIRCSPCYKRDCPIDEQCMKDMNLQTLVEAAREVLAFKTAGKR